MDELDRILDAEERLEPSSGFAAAVLDGVRREAAEPPPLPFPWLRFALGLCACLVLAAAAAPLAARLASGQLPWPRQLAGAAPVLGYAALALLGSLVTAGLPRVFARR